LGRAYDESKFDETICIKRILAMMRTANIVDRERLVEFLEPTDAKKRAGLLARNDDHLRSDGVEILFRRRPTFNSSVALRKAMNVRHNEIAHRSAEATAGRPSFEDVDNCLSWGKEFIGMVGKAFSNIVFKYDDGGFWSDNGVKSTIFGLQRLCHVAGIVIDPQLLEHDRQKAELLSLPTS
jgi:hypothetical protein